MADTATDGFTDLIDRSITFFRELAENNNKDWYAPRKEYYTAQIKKPAELLGDVIRDDIARLTGREVTAKLFRIHRDVRFSKDKSPYNAHLHLMWRPTKEGSPVWFFGASPQYLTVGMGVMGLSGTGLNTYRAMVDQQGDDLSEALDDARNAVDATISDWGPEPLKRVPKPYDVDHPHADLLKRKSLTLNTALAEDWRATGLQKAIVARMRGMMPVWTMLDEVFG